MPPALTDAPPSIVVVAFLFLEVVEAELVIALIAFIVFVVLVVVLLLILVVVFLDDRGLTGGLVLQVDAVVAELSLEQVEQFVDVVSAPLVEDLVDELGEVTAAEHLLEPLDLLLGKCLEDVLLQGLGVPLFDGIRCGKANRLDRPLVEKDLHDVHPHNEPPHLGAVSPLPDTERALRRQVRDAGGDDDPRSHVLAAGYHGGLEPTTRPDGRAAGAHLRRRRLRDESGERLSQRMPATRPPPSRVEYASYGVSLNGSGLIHPGEVCAIGSPCILGGGGGLGLHGGYRWAGPWYLGGAYQVSRNDSSNLYRLPTLQQLRVELRYMLDLGYRTVPYATWGGGGVVYGNEFGVETGGGTVFFGTGFELQLSRLAILGLAARYQPMLFAGFTDTAGFERPLGLAHYAGIDLLLEVRREVSGR